MIKKIADSEPTDYMLQVWQIGEGGKPFKVVLDANDHLARHFVAKVVCPHCDKETLVDRDHMIAVMSKTPIKEKDFVKPLPLEI